MTIGISARATVQFDMTSIPGARSRIGGGRSRCWNPSRRSIQRGSEFWGTSYASGHVLALGATDRRIRAVASQVPTISGYEQGLRRAPPDAGPMAEGPRPLANGYAQSGCRCHPRSEARGHPDGVPAQLELKTERFGMTFRLFLALRFCPPGI
jgi:hypothetical protein